MVTFSDAEVYYAFRDDDTVGDLAFVVVVDGAAACSPTYNVNAIRFAFFDSDFVVHALEVAD